MSDDAAEVRRGTMLVSLDLEERRFVEVDEGSAIACVELRDADADNDDSLGWFERAGLGALTGAEAGTLRTASSTVVGRRAIRGNAVPCREDDVDDDSWSRAEARVAPVVLVLRGIPDGAVASDSSLRRVDRVFSPC